MSDSPYNTTSGPRYTTVTGFEARCAHCWHYKVNAAGPKPFDRCCYCGITQQPRAEIGRYGHGPYA